MCRAGETPPVALSSLLQKGQSRSNPSRDHEKPQPCFEKLGPGATVVWVASKHIFFLFSGQPETCHSCHSCHSGPLGPKRGFLKDFGAIPMTMLRKQRPRDAEWACFWRLLSPNVRNDKNDRPQGGPKKNLINSETSVPSALIFGLYPEEPQ